MQSNAISPQEYMDTLPEDRKPAVEKLRDALLKNLPAGFEEVMQYGMISYVVPHAIYPDGYHCNPKQALPFISLASQKATISLYHMGLYADDSLLQWFTTEYPKHSAAKPDIGKSCIRFKKPETIPYKLVGELAAKWPPQQWIAVYEASFKK